jgi:hypothetical protein
MGKTEGNQNEPKPNLELRVYTPEQIQQIREYVEYRNQRNQEDQEFQYQLDHGENLDYDEETSNEVKSVIKILAEKNMMDKQNKEEINLIRKQDEEHLDFIPEKQQQEYHNFEKDYIENDGQALQNYEIKVNDFMQENSEANEYNKMKLLLEDALNQYNLEQNAINLNEKMLYKKMLI